MNGKLQFTAPWSALLKAFTGSACALLLAMAVLGCVVPGMPLLARVLLIVTPLLITGGSALCVVRGYEVTPDTIFVQRLLWQTPISLTQLKAVALAPDATRGSVRTCGNGGLFVFAGWHWNRRLGRYRMFATDPRRAVLLTFEDRKVILTPDDPETFLHQVQLKAGLI